jgi:RNA polymerase sigma factor (sigma-70 family)
MSTMKAPDRGPLPSQVTELLVAHYREFLRSLEHRVGRRDVAEDILHDTFARALDKLGTVRDSEAILAWFYQALRHATVDYYRRAKLSERVQTRFAEEVDAVAEPPETAPAKVCECATRLIATLRPEHSDALHRIEVEGASIKGFAEERAISTSNAAVRVFRARDALRRELATACGPSAARGCASCRCGEDEDTAADALGSRRSGSRRRRSPDPARASAPASSASTRARRVRSSDHPGPAIRRESAERHR